MGRRKATELGRFNALCREHGVTYGQGVAMGLTLSEPKLESVGVTQKKAASRFPVKPLDCTHFSELYNEGYGIVEIAGELGVPKSTLYRWMVKLDTPSNLTRGNTRIYNPKVTPEQVYERAKAAGIQVVEGSVGDE